MATLAMKHGTEGPRHDPYAYVERIFNGDKVQVVLHDGLLTHLESNDQILTRDEKESYEQFEALTGLSVKQFDKAYNRIRSRCRCGSRKFKGQAGYPGEWLTICTNCNTVVDADFNESAII